MRKYSWMVIMDEPIILINNHKNGTILIDDKSCAHGHHISETKDCVECQHLKSIISTKKVGYELTKEQLLTIKGVCIWRYWRVVWHSDKPRKCFKLSPYYQDHYINTPIPDRKDYFIEHKKKYYQKNKDREKLRSKEYAVTHKDQIKEDRRKTRTQWYNKELSPQCQTGKGYISEKLTEKILNCKMNCSIVSFTHPFDLMHDIYGKIDVKSSKIHKDGNFRFIIKKSQNCDTFVCIGFDENRHNVLAVWIIPAQEIYHLMGLTIHSSNQKYKQFQKDITEWNNTLHAMKLETCPVLRGE